eukprot:TRINITY_DN10656_c0_g1_i1.p1 TRINITY_DN10656_c0_g1~~TRINITY_DN10656_c0_g1_i1.p1  ORF type:complete len:112 (-),score=4.27 TRINITY_DN10656_c0_g1_i1:406-741(-)
MDSLTALSKNCFILHFLSAKGGLQKFLFSIDINSQIVNYTVFRVTIKIKLDTIIHLINSGVPTSTILYSLSNRGINKLISSTPSLRRKETLWIFGFPNKGSQEQCFSNILK